MKKPRTTMVVAMLTIFTFLTSCVQEELGIYFPEKTYIINKTSYNTIEIKIIELVNDYRASNAMVNLKLSDTLSSVASSHSKHMATTEQVSHAGFDDRSSYLKWFTKSEFVGENLAFGYGTAKGTVDNWIKSEEHRKILRSNRIDRIGVAISTSANNRNYVTLIVTGKQ